MSELPTMFRVTNPTAKPLTHKYDGKPITIPAQSDLILEETKARHLQKYFPALTMEQVEVSYEPVVKQQHACPFSGCDFSTDEFAAFSEHVKGHAKQPSNGNGKPREN